MQLPSRIVDISVPLDNDTVLDYPFMRPKIEYLTGKQNAATLTKLFPGLREEDLPDGEGWAFENVQLATHNGTHMDAPYHFQSKDIHGNRMITIDEVPLDWFFRPGVKLDFRRLPDGHVVTAAEVEAELERIGHELNLRHRAGQHPRQRMHRHRRIYDRRHRHGPRGDALSDLARRARHRHRCLGLGRALRPYAQGLGGDPRPLDHLGGAQGRPRNPLLPHGEAVHLEQLPPHGFTVACFPAKVKGASGGWTRAVALFD